MEYIFALFIVLVIVVPSVVFAIFVGLLVESCRKPAKPRRAVKRAAKPKRMAGYRPGMCGHEYEHVIAKELRRCGWKAYVTQGSGDQGVDVVATKRGVKMAVQCKRSSSRVGNKAVQEVFAGMHHYGADLGVVISDNSYTNSARELANSLEGVYLAHHDQIPSFRMDILRRVEHEDHHFEDHLRDYDRITQK